MVYRHIVCSRVKVYAEGCTLVFRKNKLFIGKLTYQMVITSSAARMHGIETKYNERPSIHKTFITMLTAI